jgi:hypothetical protein
MWKKVLGWILAVVLGPLHIGLSFISKAAQKLWGELLPEIHDVEAAIKKFFNLP